MSKPVMARHLHRLADELEHHLGRVAHLTSSEHPMVFTQIGGQIIQAVQAVRGAALRLDPLHPSKEHEKGAS